MGADPGPGRALLVIDMLNDFVLPGAVLEIPPAAEILPAVARRIQAFREAGRPVIYVCDAHDPDDAEFAHWPPHAVEGTPGARVVDDLAPHPDDIMIKKKRFSGFFGTDLEERLRKLDTDHLVVTGLVTNICVLYTVADARSRDLAVTVPRDGVAGLDPGDHAFALRQMETVLGAAVV